MDNQKEDTVKQENMNQYYSQEQESKKTDTREETDKKCVDCGGTMDYDPATGKMSCPYCGRVEEIIVENEQFVAEELDFNQVEMM